MTVEEVKKIIDEESLKEEICLKKGKIKRMKW